jgi:hypothetical protein
MNLWISRSQVCWLYHCMFVFFWFSSMFLIRLMLLRVFKLHYAGFVIWRWSYGSKWTFHAQIYCCMPPESGSCSCLAVQLLQDSRCVHFQGWNVSLTTFQALSRHLGRLADSQSKFSIPCWNWASFGPYFPHTRKIVFLGNQLTENK